MILKVIFIIIGQVVRQQTILKIVQCVQLLAMKYLKYRLQNDTDKDGALSLSQTKME